MKTKLIRKMMLVGSALLIGIAVCTSVWFFLSEHKDRGSPTHENSSGEPQSGFPINNRVTPAQNPDGNPGEEQLTPEERIARHGKRNFMSIHSEEELATPHVQKILEAMDSPEHLEYLKDMRINGPSFRKWNDFLESQGVPVKREFPEMFRKYFPTGELEDYDPEMRLKIAELFLADQPVDLTDPIAAAMQRMKVVREFKNKDERHTPWFFGRFGDSFDGYHLIEREGVESNPTLVWVSNVQRNAASIVTAAEEAGGDAPDTQASAPTWDLSSVMESPSVSSDATTGGSPSVSPPAIDALEPPAIPNSENDAAATRAPGLTDVPKAPTELPTVEGFETILKSQFSSERFERAMSTLDQYGPEEGLRRLRENDPEIANQIERHRERADSEGDSR